MEILSSNGTYNHVHTHTLYGLCNYMMNNEGQNVSWGSELACDILIMEYDYCTCYFFKILIFIIYCVHNSLLTVTVLIATVVVVRY